MSIKVIQFQYAQRDKPEYIFKTGSVAVEEGMMLERYDEDNDDDYHIKDVSVSKLNVNDYIRVDKKKAVIQDILNISLEELKKDSVQLIRCEVCDEFDGALYDSAIIWKEENGEVQFGRLHENGNSWSATFGENCATTTIGCSIWKESLRT